LRVDVDADANALAPLDGARHAVDYHVDAGDVTYIPAGYYRGLRASADRATLLIYGFAPAPRKARDDDTDAIAPPDSRPDDLLEDDSSSSD
jgi:hypothetical protein